MIKKLDLLFENSSECREKTLPCKTSKQSVEKIYKPDNGLKDKDLQEELFPTNPPKLGDCIVVYNSTKVALVEIKCGTVTKSLLKDVEEKLLNTCRILKHLEIATTKCILLYKKFDNAQMNKLVTSKKICDIPLIPKKYENKALDI